MSLIADKTPLESLLETKWRPLEPSHIAARLGLPDLDENVGLDKIQSFATILMRESGLEDLGWTFGWDNAKVRAGVCKHSKKRITLSRNLMAMWPAREAADTVLHEIAHALAGPGHGHDEVWRRACRLMGADTSRCYEDDLPSVDGNWTGTCPGGHEHIRHRIPKRVQACSKCCDYFSPDYIVEWEHKDGGGPGVEYMLELVEIKRKYAA